MSDHKLIFTPSQSIQKSYLRQPIDTQSIEKFRLYMKTLLSELNPTHKEGANKGRVKTFLENTLWTSDKYEVNESGVSNADLVLKDKDLDRNVVLFEFKKVSSPEMITQDNLLRKAMFEIILYYILEECENQNTYIKHLIISDGYKYFIFEKNLFWELFGKDKRFVRNIISSEHTTGEKRDYIYNQIIKPKVEGVIDKIVFTYVDLNQFADNISNPTIINDNRFKAVYKLFSPTHLQKLPFSEDHNTLNKKFYTELLYIMGLEERGQKHQIQRLTEDRRQNYSIFEQTYSLLSDYNVDETCSIHHDEDNYFETALGLTIVWINRTLFMKLLESQLVSINSNKRKYSFFDKINDFAIMHYLFCKVMAVPEGKRSAEMKSKFGDVPYLNSSLFELTEIEKAYFPVSSLRNGEIEIMKGSCLKDKKDKVKSGKIKILDYLRQFLNSYDFGGNDDDSGKSIINASVLGLIFEKINGYKDGSFFTPGYITSYICRKTLRNCVTNKYNEKYGTSYCCFEDLLNDFDYTDKIKRDDVDKLINSIRICDPAVGSGHFLVSALNELIVIKRELNILKTRDGRRFMPHINIEDDELIITDADGEIRYNPDDPQSQKVQETLFEEKRIIIENCLFGVDINPNSADICQLRLWIELLKNAYYTTDREGKRHLQTLPNIDINIKCGNSIVMRHTLDSTIGQILRGARTTMSDYRKHVNDYKSSPSKETKRIAEQDILNIKEKLNRGYDKDSNLYKKWVQVCSEILKRDVSLFPHEEEETKILMDLRRQEAKLRIALEEMSNRYAKLNAFEWRYEFPEVLDEKGNFVGFDCIIGNPPYGVSIQGEYRKTVEDKLSHVPDYEIYYFFITLAHSLLKCDGYLAYIVPNTWLFNQHAQAFRESLINIDSQHPYAWNIIELLDCTNIPIFEAANVRNAIVIMQKSNISSNRINYKNTRDLFIEHNARPNAQIMFSNLVERDMMSIDISDLKSEFSLNWGLAFCLTPEEIRVLRNIERNSIPLGSCFNDISQGIIAYDKLKGVSSSDIDNRIFHSRTYKEGFQKWLRGFDVSKYIVTWNSNPSRSGSNYANQEIYVDYYRIPKVREQKYFIGKRMLVREITNPSIYAAITEEELYHDPAILVFKDSPEYSLELACGILNSRLAAFYHFRHSPKATKGSFPKIMISDLRSFPLPIINKDNEKFANDIQQLVRDLQNELKKEPLDEGLVSSIEWQIDLLVFKLYGIENSEISIISKDFIEENPTIS